MSTTIVVLGTHRSGTSCITRMLNICGREYFKTQDLVDHLARVYGFWCINFWQLSLFTERKVREEERDRSQGDSAARAAQAGIVMKWGSKDSEASSDG